MDNSYGSPVRKPIPAQYYEQPDTTRLTVEQEYNRWSNKLNRAVPQSNPYNDYVNLLNQCSEITREKITNDPRFIEKHSLCKNYIDEYLYSQAIPYVLEIPQCRIAFEQLAQITDGLKNEYTQRDLQKERQFELLMEDPIILQRLQELQNEQKQQHSRNSNTKKQAQSHSQSQAQSEVTS